MSQTPAEKIMKDLIDMFHHYTDDDDMIGKDNVLKMLKEKFPNFLSDCVSLGLVRLGLQRERGFSEAWRGRGRHAGPTETHWRMLFWEVDSLYAVGWP